MNESGLLVGAKDEETLCRISYVVQRPLASTMKLLSLDVDT